ETEIGEPPSVPRPQSGLSEAAKWLPLTGIQQTYWNGRSSNLGLGSGACHVYQEHDASDLDTRRLEQALNLVIERHSALRTEFCHSGGQVVRKQVAPFRITTEDLSRLDAVQQSLRLDQKRDALANRVLPYYDPPLIDCQATLLDSRRMRIHWSFDLLILDQWSLPVLSEELHALYRNPAAPLPRPIHGIEERLEKLARTEYQQLDEADRRSVRQRLSDLPPELALPRGRSWGEIARPTYRRRRATIAGSRRAELERRAQSIRLSVTELLLAAFADTVRSWSTNGAFTLCVIRRDRMDTQRRVGSFAEHELIEVQDTGGTFAQCAANLDGQLARYRNYHQVGAFEPPRDVAETATCASLAPVAFTCTLDQIPASREPFGWLGREKYGTVRIPQVSLHHSVHATTDGIALIWDSVEEAFPSGMLDKMFASYLSFIEQLFKCPDLERLEGGQRPASVRG
ncbi:MAG TPA: condensation domain-containing protein, partial [Polyangiaceae bacterium]|nr:condensation domain-containing protein [Polyangiaceae bacterium]